MDIIEGDPFLFNVMARDAFLPLPTPNSIVASPDHPCGLKESFYFPKPGGKCLHLAGEVIKGMCCVMRTSVEHKEVWVLWSTSITNDLNHTPVIVQPGRLCKSGNPMEVSIHVGVSREAKFDQNIMRGDADCSIPIKLMVCDLYSILHLY